MDLWWSKKGGKRKFGEMAITSQMQPKQTLQGSCLFLMPTLDFLTTICVFCVFEHVISKQAGGLFLNVANSPINVLDTDDPGDETLARFRYQCSSAAINCVRLILYAHEAVTVICENFEDILIERPDGSFIGLQVKTRQLSSDPFTATEAVIIKSLRRFCELDKRFPGQFCTFDFSTNHSFWEKSANERNLRWILKSLKERGNTKRLPKKNPMRKLVNSICEGTDLTPDIVDKTLLKTVLNSRLEGIDGITPRVTEVVSQCPGACDFPLSRVAKIAEDIVNICFQASSKKTTGDQSQLYAAGVDFHQTVKQHEMAGKCIKKKDIEDLINSHCSVSEPLELSGLVPIGSLPPHLATMIQKLDKGGLQVARINEMSDLVKSFEHLLVKWVRRFGPDITKERYQSLLVKVKFDCTEAQVSSETPNAPYAPQMYEALLERLKVRVADAHDELHGCSREHLMGAAGMLTEQCKAWWSKKFEIKEHHNGS